MRPLLEVQDLRAEFSGYGHATRILNGVDLILEEGKVLGLVGESGSGKTILALAIMRLLPLGAHVTRGDVRFLGQSLLSLNEAELRAIRGKQMALVVPNPKLALNPVLRIGDQLANVYRMREGLSKREAWDRGTDMLKSVGINDPLRRARSYPHELSGGMAQRVVIAMALSSGPRLLIADEPSSGVDVTVQVQVLDLIKKQIKERNMGAIIATRDLGIVAQYCDEVAILYAGQIVERANVSDFFREPLHPYSGELIRAFSPQASDNGHRRIPGAHPSPANLPAGCYYNPRCPLATDICHRVEPRLMESLPAHVVRCLAYDEGTQ
jgi:oligopeptide/dipeptide ABC transporter ATP-binding protein